MILVYGVGNTTFTTPSFLVFNPFATLMLLICYLSLVLSVPERAGCDFYRVKGLCIFHI